MKTFLLLILLGAGLYYFVYRPNELEKAGPGGPVTLEMRSDEVLKDHGKPAQMHTESGGREVWIYEDGRLVEFRDHEVIRSEPPGVTTAWTRLSDGSWVRPGPGVNAKANLAKKAPVGPTPRGNAAALKAREQWGWDRQGTSLDQPAKPAK